MLEQPTSATARAMIRTPHHMLAESRSPSANCFINATKTMPPPRRSIHMEASMCMRPATMRSTDERSKMAGTPSTISILKVTLGSRSICALSAGSLFAWYVRMNSRIT
eukprot:scaffold98354_cov35-Tisochrysis_lutea.AAC.5